jgi:TonB family protein
LFCISYTSKLTSLVLSSIISATAPILCTHAQEKTNAQKDAPPPFTSVPDTNKEQDGLIGPVRRIRTERAELSTKSGKLIEGPRSLLSTTTYNLQGNSIDNTHYLTTEGHRSLGKEEYKYDNKGNLTEMTLRNDQGRILSREVYTYEFDVVGNWNKMITSLVIYEGGKLSYEPVEVTYRSISYYFTEDLATGENSPALQEASPAVSTTADTARKGVADGHAVGSQTAARSDNTGKSRSIVPQGTTANSGSRPDLSPAGTRVTDNQEVKDQSELLMPKPQARLFSDTANNQVIMIPNATYPEEAKRAGVTGTVAVSVEIDPVGNVMSARAIRGHAMLRAAAVEAALKAHFTPTHKDRAAKRSGVITFTFALVQ